MVNGGISMDIDLDKDAIRRPRPIPASRRKRPSAIKCAVVLCALIGFGIFATFCYFMGKGFYMVYDNARNPYKDLYLNATSLESAGPDGVVLPLIGQRETFDVYFTIWTRVPDAQVDSALETATMDRERERFGAHLDTIKKMTKVPEKELLVNPTEQVVFSEKVFEGVKMGEMNLHKDISFELPLDRFRDKNVFHHDIRGAAVLVPSSRETFDNVKEWTQWKPEGAKSLGRLDDETAGKLGLSGLQRDLLDVTSVSFAMIELHDRNYLNSTTGTEEKEEKEHEYFQEGEGDDADESMTDRYKRWQTYQPHFVTKSHVYILDEARPLNRTAFDKKHKEFKEGSCGQSLSLPPTRYLCHRHSLGSGMWEHRLVMQDDQIRYGSYVDILRHMAGPRHLQALPVRRGKPFDPSLDQKSVTVHHQISFSSFGPGRLHLFDNFVQPSDVDKNATDAHYVQAHNDWEQMNGILGNRGQGTHPRTRFILGFVEDILLGLPAEILTLLYWYTRSTTAGLHSYATLLAVGHILCGQIMYLYRGAVSSTFSWEMYVFGLVFGGLDIFQAVTMLRLILPFELVWGSWVPTGLRRVGWTKRERDTRRLERKVDWTRRALLFAAFAVASYAISYWKLWLVRPLHTMPTEHSDMVMSKFSNALMQGATESAIILQLVLNHHSRSFAGQYALHAYMVLAQRAIQLLRFWPWFVGRYEVRGGLGWSAVITIALEVTAVWQALTLPRVEQVVAEEEEEDQ